jgi:hypothetical protein
MRTTRILEPKMDTRIQQLLTQIMKLEDELRNVLSEQQSTILFQIKGKRVEFEQSIKEMHLKLKKNFFHCNLKLVS